MYTSCLLRSITKRVTVEFKLLVRHKRGFQNFIGIHHMLRNVYRSWKKLFRYKKSPPKRAFQQPTTGYCPGSGIGTIM